jgi:hypothetical protein
MTDIILYQAPGPIDPANLAPTERSWLSWGYYLLLLWVSFIATRWILRCVVPTQHVTKADPQVEDDFTPSSSLSLGVLHMSRFPNQEAVNLATFVTRRAEAANMARRGQWHVSS